ncbi:MAG: M28 family peptidase [Dysgonamonadaceae bacterium]|nr:M28 family peptidase [Fermentimonas sp.]MDD3901740.1 M28 family peptidase [Dysgonamonadaceae bacterium]
MKDVVKSRNGGDISVKNNGKLIILFCFLILFIIFCAITGCSRQDQDATDSASMKACSVDDAIAASDINRIMDTISVVSSYKRRMGSQGEKDTYNYLKKLLESYGYSTTTQIYPYDLQKELPRNYRDAKDTSFWYVDVSDAKKDGESQNLIAIKKPSKANVGNIVVVSAHYDDTGYGAVIDNATGVSVLMEVARLTANLDLNTEIRFILVSGEEFGLNGSRYYVSKLNEQDKQHILANINLDYVGEKGDNNLILATIDGKENAASDLFREFSQKKEVSIIRGPLSDYISFARAGIPSVSLGQLPTPIKMENIYSVDIDREKAVVEIEKSRLDEGRLKTSVGMVIKALSRDTGI